MPDTALATCTGCGAHNDNRRWIQPADRAGHYLALCRDCERSRARARRANGTSRRAPRIAATTALGLNRKFGVEIECNVPGGYHGATATRIREQLPTGWRLKYDGSLGGNGVEVVGPAMRGEQGLDALRQVCETLARNGATVDRRCGLHVHHEVQDIGRDGLVHFIRSWAANQDLIDWLVSPSRRNNLNTYCRRWADSELSNVFSAGRYKTANVQSFSKYGTVEIRQHQGTLSFRKIESWIRLTQAMLDQVAGRGRAFGSYGSLRGLLDGVGVDEDAAAFLLGRAVQFGAPATQLAGAVA